MGYGALPSLEIEYFEGHWGDVASNTSWWILNLSLIENTSSESSIADEIPTNIDSTCVEGWIKVFNSHNKIVDKVRVDRIIIFCVELKCFLIKDKRIFIITLNICFVKNYYAESKNTHCCFTWKTSRKWVVSWVYNHAIHFKPHWTGSKSKFLELCQEQCYLIVSRGAYAKIIILSSCRLYSVINVVCKRFGSCDSCVNVLNNFKLTFEAVFK